MPSIHKGSYRLYFVSQDCSEPAHMHVERENMDAKFWLEPVVIARNEGYAKHELRKIERMIVKHHREIMEVWDEHCGRR